MYLISWNKKSPCFKNGITHFSRTTFPAALDELSSLLNESDVSTRKTKWIGSSKGFSLIGSLQWASSVIIRSFNFETVWMFSRAFILKTWVEPVGRLSTQIWSVLWCRFILKCELFRMKTLKISKNSMLLLWLLRIGNWDLMFVG